MQQKFSRATDPEFDYHALKKRLAIGFWIYFAIYSCYWGGFYVWSKNANNLAYVDFATSAYFGFTIVLYIVLGTKLVKAINKYLKHEDGLTDESAPGTKSIVTLITFSCIAMFLRMIFVSLQDVQKLAKIDSISKDTSYWPALMFVQCCT